MPTTVTVRGQVTLPKAFREAAGIKPGDRVNVRARPEGGAIIEPTMDLILQSAFRARIEDLRRRRPIRDMTTDEIMRITRGED